MGIIRVDSNKSDIKLLVSGDIQELLTNRRAVRFLKDTMPYELIGEEIVFSIPDTLNKCIDRLKIAAGYAKCEVQLSQSANEDIQDYIREEEKFEQFSSNALHIRNNECDINAFNEFKNSLIDNLPTRTLYPLQMLSAYHLAFSQNACNFSVPGAGKTSIVYGAYAYLKNLPHNHLKKVDRLLIIGPLNAFGPWELEFKECFGISPSVKRLTGMLTLDEKKQYFYDDDPAEITLLSYASVVSLVEDLKLFLRKHRVMVVLDEAHKIKNTSGGITAQSIMAIAEPAASRVILTGTPAPNGYEDLYNLFKFIWPSKNIIRFQIGQLKDMTKNADAVRIQSLLDRIEPYYIRIKKSDLGIPAPTNNPPVVVSMGEHQRKIYDYIETKYVSDIVDSRDQRFQNELIQAKLIRLTQAATNPALLLQPLSEFMDTEGVAADSICEDATMLREIANFSNTEIPAKYIMVRNLVRDLIQKGEKVIVWACYIKNIELLRDYLEAQGIGCKTLYGATPVAGELKEEESEDEIFTREAIVREFHNPESSFKVIIANPFAVSESISLHKACHNAIYMERSFNAAHFIQSKDRIHRYGLTQDVKTNYYYLLSEDSIDSTIHQRLEEKEKRLLDIIENMPIPLFSNVSDDDGNEDVKAVLRDYARRVKTK